MLNDLRYAVRMLLQAKGWTAVVVVSLALGIGANTAIFSAMNGLLLRQIPVTDPDTLVRLRWAGRNQMATNTSDYGSTRVDASGQSMRTTFSYPMYQQFAKDNQTMSDLFACAPAGRVNVVVNGQAELATAFVSTGTTTVCSASTRPRPRHHPRRRSARCDSSRRDQRQVLAAEVWQRPGRHRQSRHGQHRAR